MDVIGIALRVLLGAVLLYAGWSKMRSRTWPSLALEAGVPRLVVLGLPAFELILGLGLVGQVYPQILSWIALGVFLAFLVVVSVQFFTGAKVPCNCFGGNEEAIVGWVTIARNLVLAGLALVAASVFS